MFIFRVKYLILLKPAIKSFKSQRSVQCAHTCANSKQHNMLVRHGSKWEVSEWTWDLVSVRAIYYCTRKDVRKWLNAHLVLTACSVRDSGGNFANDFIAKIKITLPYKKINCLTTVQEIRLVTDGQTNRQTDGCRSVGNRFPFYRLSTES